MGVSHPMARETIEIGKTSFNSLFVRPNYNQKIDQKALKTIQGISSKTSTL